MKPTETTPAAPFFAALNGIVIKTRIHAGARRQEQNDK